MDANPTPTTPRDNELASAKEAIEALENAHGYLMNFPVEAHLDTLHALDRSIFWLKFVYLSGEADYKSPSCPNY